jgi:hypothetical protein
VLAHFGAGGAFYKMAQFYDFLGQRLALRDLEVRAQCRQNSSLVGGRLALDRFR